MGKIRDSKLGFGIGRSSQTSIFQSHYDEKVNSLLVLNVQTKNTILMKNNIHPHNLPIKSTPNSTIIQRDDKGRIVRIRYYDEKGNAYKDIDHTDHGRPDIHKVPHTHEIKITDIIERKKGVLPNANRNIYGSNQKRI